MNEDNKDLITGGNHKHMAGRGTWNRDWWPDELKLHILHQQIRLGAELLVQDMELQFVRPPVPVRRASAGHVFVITARYQVLAIFIHDIYSFRCENC